MRSEQPNTASLTLVSHHLCPYVQRAAIVLAEKGVACERRYIDLTAKPVSLKSRRSARFRFARP